MIQEAKNWKIVVRFHNGQHQEVSKLQYQDQKIPGNTKVRQFLDPKLIPLVQELKWNGFGLWAQHEPVTTQTQFDDLNYQRKPDGLLLLDNEDHNCQYRAILTPVVKEETCVVCQNAKPTSCLLCMHYCVCKGCFNNIQRCPICRKRKPVKK